MMVGEIEVKERPRPSPDYLMQLLNEKKLMTSLPNLCGIFTHLERLLDEEINRVRKDMYSDSVNGLVGKQPLDLPEPNGTIIHQQEKLFVPVKEYPDYNFVGRILGPRGLTTKQLEAETGCKIMVRGKSSMRDKKKEEQNRGKPNWEHLNEDLHVLITVEDTQARAEIKMKRAMEEVKKLLVPAAEGEDNLKKMQLMELAILNGTYRDTNLKTPTLAFSLAAAAAAAQGTRLIAGPPGQGMPPQGMRPPTPGGPPLMNLIRPQMTAIMPNGTPTLVPPSPDGGIIYTTPYDYPYTLAPTSLLEYPIDHSGVLGKRPWGSMGAAPGFSQPGQEGLFYPGGVLDAASMSHNQDLFKGAMASKVRRHDSRVHPYQRIVTPDRGQFRNPCPHTATLTHCNVTHMPGCLR
ncbi:protein quaking-A isoform X3 [Gadus morhua]|uniref:protein quaking-A isoform X3 n=1 Tax=Gadus morhua TaxID=8049 RepID=UPI0011B5F4F6|nr:protein quaking-A isoform X3 [Gadus morhua]XP_056446190.1 protein quaking-A isoform X3 [Gadus chalcogrammus]